MIKVEFNKQNENPFYGKNHTLAIFQQGSKGTGVTTSKLEAAWKECSDELERAMLMCVLFSIGDVAARQHNVFDKKGIDKGGNSQRELFRDTVIPFIVSKYSNRDDIQRLIHLIVEYTTVDNILANRVVTKKGTSQFVRAINMVDVFGIDEVASYCAKVILFGSEFQKMCVAKFLSRPRFSKRPGKKQMLPETKVVMARQAKLLKKVSDIAKLGYEEKESYTNFSGYYNWRKPYIENTESVLFSTGAVREMDKDQFLTWLNSVPAEARFRVRNRVMFSVEKDGKTLKWAEQAQWFKEFEAYKEQKQEEQRKLETAIKAGIVDKEEVSEKLKELKKEAKVTLGATSFDKLFGDIVTGKVDKLKVQPFLDQINLPYNTLVIADRSGSMTWGRYKDLFFPFEMAAFIATICMMKNPSEEASNLLGFFASNADLVSGISKVETRPNSLMASQARRVAPQPLINKNDHFLKNLKRMQNFFHVNSNGGRTRVNEIPRAFAQWVNGDPQRLEELMQYPVWTLISDGEFNNAGNVAQSMNVFMADCQNLLGYKPFVIIIDVAHTTSAEITTLQGIENVMMVPPNPAAIETFLTRFRDMDTFDVYTPLLSLYRSNRYDPVKDFTLNRTKSKAKTTKVKAKAKV